MYVILLKHAILGDIRSRSHNIRDILSNRLMESTKFLRYASQHYGQLELPGLEPDPI